VETIREKKQKEKRMFTEIRYNVTHNEFIPASIWGKAINRKITDMQVNAENVQKIKNIVKIQVAPRISDCDVTQGGKFGCE
jgi:hypothetical protein